VPAHSRGITPLDWQRLVSEALARRKEEGLTQREHAALAGVSVPTIASFDRGEVTLSLAKAFDILRVVGLLDEQPEDGAQERFLANLSSVGSPSLPRLLPIILLAFQTDSTVWTIA
jgi:transcriptional regulator with XRE-family HTH domain